MVSRKGAEAQYRVNDVSYVGNRTQAVWAFAGDRQWAEAQVARYPQGARTVAYYDPKQPKRAVLSPGLNRWVVRMGAVGLAFMVVGSFLMGWVR